MKYLFYSAFEFTEIMSALTNGKLKKSVHNEKEVVVVLRRCGGLRAVWWS